jgi:hypothetical protein
VNGKSYVGQTVNSLERRREIHLFHANRGRRSAFHCALRKYGAEKFDWVVIDSAGNLDELNNKEKHWISLLNTLSPNGYNLTDGGAQPRLTDEVRKRISRTLQGRKLSAEHKNKQSHALLLKQDSDPQYLANLVLMAASQGRKNHSRRHFSPMNDEWRANIGAGNRGKNRSEEWKARISATKRAQNLRITDEHRARIIECNTGRFHSPETRAKISATKKANWLKRTPEERALFVAKTHQWQHAI